MLASAMRVTTAAPASLNFTDALCARLCHDLATPLGSLTAAVELAGEGEGEQREALELAGETARDMVARLRLLRAAWAGRSGELTRTEIAALARGVKRRIEVNLDALAEGPFEEAVSRLLLNLLLLGAEALPRGGAVLLQGNPTDGFVLSASGPSVNWGAGLTAALLDPDAVDEHDPRHIQAPLTAWLARDAAMVLSFLLPPGPGEVPRLLAAPR